ncbi:hypothetical protein GCM10029964_055510 [Kibdelosporangium lantanae]
MTIIAGRPERLPDSARIVASALAVEGVVNAEGFHSWFARRNEQDSMYVEQVPLDSMTGWHFTPDRASLAHDSGRFFSVEGVHVTRHDGGTVEWSQPIISQPEVGILGYLVKEFHGVLHFLVQAKVEPGNREQLQLAPTVQATRSNYTKVHGGAATPYLEHFLPGSRGRVIVDVLQSEQGSWFLRKRNRNMVVETTDEVEPRENFCWVTLGQLRAALATPHMVNMDARSVLACLPLPTVEWPDHDGLTRGRYAADLRRSMWTTDTGCCRHTGSEIVSWLNDVRTGTTVGIEPVPLARLADWEISTTDIAHREEGTSGSSGSR